MVAGFYDSWHNVSTSIKPSFDLKVDGGINFYYIPTACGDDVVYLDRTATCVLHSAWLYAFPTQQYKSQIAMSTEATKILNQGCSH